MAGIRWAAPKDRTIFREQNGLVKDLFAFGAEKVGTAHLGKTQIHDTLDEA
jgi:hypothetical protein